MKLKLPEVFIPEKHLKKNVEKLTGDEDEEKTMSTLQKSCYDFIQEVEGENNKEEYNYNVGVDIAEGLSYDRKDLESLCKIFILNEEDTCLGWYFSALVNKIIEEKKVINLEFERPLDGLGAYLKQGSLNITGNTNWFTGYGMEGGKIFINGDVVGCSLGLFAEDGIIHVNGKIEHFAEGNCNAKIYRKGKEIWPDPSLAQKIRHAYRTFKKTYSTEKPSVPTKPSPPPAPPAKKSRH